MLSFFLGFLSALAVLFTGAMFARRRWRRRRRRGRGAGRAGLSGRLIRYLKVGPDQEPEVREAIDELVVLSQALGQDLRGARKEAAEALRDDALDEPRVEGLMSGPNAALQRLEAAFGKVLARLHAILDPSQRERLASLLERGPWALRRGCGRRAQASAS